MRLVEYSQVEMVKIYKCYYELFLDSEDPWLCSVIQELVILGFSLGF